MPETMICRADQLGDTLTTFMAGLPATDTEVVGGSFE